MYFAIELDIGEHRVGTQAIQHGLGYARSESGQHLAVGVAGGNPMLARDFSGPGAVVGPAMAAGALVTGDDDLAETTVDRCGAVLSRTRVRDGQRVSVRVSIGGRGLI